MVNKNRLSFLFLNPKNLNFNTTRMKITCSIVLLLVGHAVSSQNVESFGVFGGFNVPITFDDGLQRDPRFVGKVTFRATPIGLTYGYDHVGFGFVISPSLTKIGQKFILKNTVGGDVGSREVQMDYISVPVALKLHLNDMSFFRLSAVAALNFNYLINGKEIISHSAAKLKYPQGVMIPTEPGYIEVFDGVLVPEVTNQEYVSKDKFNSFQLFAAVGLRSDFDLNDDWSLNFVAMVLQIFVMDSLGVHFIWTVFITIALIWVYTFRGGIKTIVITDTLQTVSMLTAVILTIWYIGKALDLNGIGEITSAIYKSEYSKWWFFDRGWNDPNNFFKQFISGALIALVMTGMDQDMMQKNLTCRNLVSAQKNMLTFSIILFFANILFLALGALLYMFAAQNGISIPEATDQLYPTIALNHLPPEVGILFILGLIAAAYSSADSALTSLTTAFCIDFLGFERTGKSEAIKKSTRLKVHIGFSLLILVIIVLFKYLIDSAVINGLFKAAGYTYGPILGLFTYGILSKRKIKDKWVVPICLLAPVITYIIDTTSDKWLGGFQFGFTILALNGILTILGLMAISKKSHTDGQNN